MRTIPPDYERSHVGMGVCSVCGEINDHPQDYNHTLRRPTLTILLTGYDRLYSDDLYLEGGEEFYHREPNSEKSFSPG